MEQNLVVHHSSGKNYKPKGFNYKKALQAALLLAVCIWLLYQFKYSHGKHKSHGGNTQNKLSKEHGSLLLGRKGNVGFIVESTVVFKDENALEEDEKRDREFDRNVEQKEDEVTQQRQHMEETSNGKEATASPKKSAEESIKTKEDNVNTQVIEEDENASFVEEKDDASEMGEEKIALQISEAESTINVVQGELGSGVQGFLDENGVPPDGLHHLNSTSYEPNRDDDQENSKLGEIILSSNDQNDFNENTVFSNGESVDSFQGSHERNDTEASTGNTILRREQVESQEQSNFYYDETESKSNLEGSSILENSGAKVYSEAGANLDIDRDGQIL